MKAVRQTIVPGDFEPFDSQDRSVIAPIFKKCIAVSSEADFSKTLAEARLSIIVLAVMIRISVSSNRYPTNSPSVSVPTPLPQQLWRKR